MRKSYVVLMAAIISVGFSAALVAQTAPAAAAAGGGGAGGAARAGRGGRGGGRGAATPPHAAVADQDARFGTQYSNNAPATFTAEYAVKAAWDKRAEFVRHQALVAEGQWPLPPKTPLNAVVYGKIDKSDYTVEKVFFQSMPGHYVTGSLYRPKNVTGKVPVILMPYGHWGNSAATGGPANGGRFWVKDDATAQADIASGAEKEISNSKAPLQASATQVARMGMIAFQWDLVGYCDSSVIAHQEGFTDADAVMRLQSFMGLQAWNTNRAVDFVSTLPDVDTTKIGISGSSGGGTQSFIAGTLDSRLAGLFVICMVGADNQGGCICENTSLLRVNTNNVEFAATFAPKPQFDVAANDMTTNFLTTGKPYMEKIYALEGASDNFGTEKFNFPHNHNSHSRADIYQAMNRDFKLGLPADRLEEKPYDVLSKAELTVWSSEHPIPADFSKAPVLREYMTKTNDAQMAALEKNPAEYRDTIKVGLQAMVNDELPLAREVESTADLTKSDGVQKGFISRKGANERIPFAVSRPANWNGSVVILSGNGAGAADSAADITKTGAMVVALDTFMSNDFKRAGAVPAAPGTRNGYSGFSNGYERTILANRAHDLLSVIGLVHGMQGAKSIRLVGTGEESVAAIYAAAIAGPAIDRLAVDLAGFDFDKVKDESDPQFIPGGIKYGGVYGALPVYAGEGRKAMVAGARETGKYSLAAATAGVTLDKDSKTPAELATWAAGM